MGYEVHSTLDNVILDNEIGKRYRKNYEQNEETLVSEEQNAFTNWFGECWEKAGGQALHLPSFFVFHDEYRSFDLKSKQWIENVEKWS